MTAITPTRIVPSKYQEPVYFNLITTQKDILIDAGPGSGKTTTIVESAKLLPYGKRAVFVAFNKRIVNELKERLPATVQCSTMHSMGCRAIFSSYPGDGNSINEKKQIRYLEPLCEKPGRTPKEKWVMIKELDRIMQLMRLSMTSLSKEAIETLCTNHGLEMDEDWPYILIKAIKALYAYNDDPDRYTISIDFTDMIEHCVRNKNVRMPQFDYVYVDECQDLSELDHLFLAKIIRPVTGRLIAVGDEKQSIYSFRGASPESFAKLKRRSNVIILPLPICYRSTKEIVKHLKTIYPDVEEWEGAEQGIPPKVGKVEDIREGDYVLCRNNYPLLETFFMLIEAGKKAYVLGKDLENGLHKLLNNFDVTAKTKECLEDLETLLEDKKYDLLQKGIVNPDKHPKYVVLEEKVRILRLLFNKFHLILDVLEFIEHTFNDEEREGVALMSIHKSKGLENDRVFVIETFAGTPLIPSKYATTKQQLIQERNLKFVAYSRPKKELFLLHL